VTTAAWVTLVLVCGFVWGGFAALLARALRCERGRSAARRGERGGPGRGPE
jgi:hypothetical protein